MRTKNQRRPGVMFPVLSLVWLVAGCPGSLEGDATQYLVDFDAGSGGGADAGGGAADGGGMTGTDGGGGMTGDFECSVDPAIDPLNDIFLAEGTGGCQGDGCHSDGSAFGAYEGDLSALVGTDTMFCNELPLIDADNPAESAIITKLGAEPPCGATMPFNQDPLSADQIACVTEYIEFIVGAQ